MTDWLQQAAVIEPVHPFQGFQLHRPPCGPRASMNHFSLVKTIDGLSQSIVVRVTDTPDRWLNTGFDKTLGIANGHVLHATVTVVNESTLLDWATGVKGLLQVHRVQNRYALNWTPSNRR
uniref:Uncharacterized protein n=1 Tax=Pseudomonas savastanoi TaxID=29438 RepID=Q52505_PSESS|nr:unknown protein [Pseudomonas savastanoi]